MCVLCCVVLCCVVLCCVVLCCVVLCCVVLCCGVVWCGVVWCGVVCCVVCACACVCVCVCVCACACACVCVCVFVWLCVCLLACLFVWLSVGKGAGVSFKVNLIVAALRYLDFFSLCVFVRLCLCLCLCLCMCVCVRWVGLPNIALHWQARFPASANPRRNEFGKCHLTCSNGSELASPSCFRAIGAPWPLPSKERVSSPNPPLPSSASRYGRRPHPTPLALPAPACAGARGSQSADSAETAVLKVTAQQGELLEHLGIQSESGAAKPFFF